MEFNLFKNDNLDEVLNNRLDIKFVFDVRHGSPNTDPDSLLPRTLPSGHGLVSDVSIKRGVRDMIQRTHADVSRMDIIIKKGTCLNTAIAKGYADCGISPTKEPIKKQVKTVRERVCADYFDVRVFGCVLSTGANAGQVDGPAQVVAARSLDPVDIVEMSLTRVCSTDGITGNRKEETKLPPGIKKADKRSSWSEWKNFQEAIPEQTLRTMGEKAIIPYGLYTATISVSAFKAQQTGMTKRDVNELIKALYFMYDHNRSASKGEMNCRGIYVFKHVGFSGTPEAERLNQARLGCAPAHKLMDSIEFMKKPDVDAPLAYSDYEMHIGTTPEGVELHSF
jgi:CRISPR-associated protein Csd2